MKTDKNVSSATVVATVFIISTATTFGAQNCSDAAGAATLAACCERTNAAARPIALQGNSPALTLTISSHIQGQKPATDEAAQTVPQGIQNLLTSAASLANVSPLKEHRGLQSEQTLGSLTNNFARLGFQTTDAQSKEEKPFPLEFSGQTDKTTGATDWLRVRHDFASRDDALISGSKGKGLSFALSRSARDEFSVNAETAGRSEGWRGHAANDFGQFERGRISGGENWATIEPEGLRLFSWRW